MYLKRFSTSQKIAHFLISLSILMLLITGLPITFKSLKWVIDVFGGPQNTMLLHRFFALVLLASIVYFGVYFILERLSGKGEKILSTDLIKNSIKDLLWALNLSKERPKFGKYDWIMVADIIGVPILVIIIGISGIFMWIPHLFVASNPALFFAFRTIHAFFAIFFLLFVFAHAGILHLTPGNFPMNMSIFTGLIEDRKAKVEHPLWAEKAEKIAVEPKQYRFNPIGYVAYAISVIALVLLIYTAFVMTDEGLAGLRVEENALIAVGLNLSMLIVFAYLIATVYGGIYGIVKRHS